MIFYWLCQISFIVKDCSREEARTLHSKLATTSDVTAINNLLCETIIKIKRDCAIELQRCLTMKEVKWFMNTYLEEMEKYLLGMAFPDKDIFKIGNCSDYDEIRY